MPRLILKSPYLKPNAKQHLVNYTQYVATREGVERPEAAAGKTQRKVIAELLKEYPDIRELYESEDYRLNPVQQGRLRHQGILLERSVHLFPFAETNQGENLRCQRLAGSFHPRPLP